MRRSHSIIVSGVLIVVLGLPLSAQTRAPEQENLSAQTAVSLSRLPLEPTRRLELEVAIQRRDYKRAERILVEEVERDPKSPAAARLLAVAGGIFFLDGDYLNSAIAYKKAETITRPGELDERSRFTLAMAYIKLNRRDWARPQLEKLEAQQPSTPLYLYWLARLDYDAQEYNRAITRFQRAIELDPKMMRAYDSPGLCYDYLARYDDAISSYKRAIEINRSERQPSPWPNLNLAITLIALNNLTEAEDQLREALRYDANMAQARYQLGQVLEKRGKYAEAIESLAQAAALDPAYPEPHYSLGRIYQRQGQTEQAKRSIERFQHLRKARKE